MLLAREIGDRWLGPMHQYLSGCHEHIIDNLRSRYTAIADDEGASASVREAAMFISLAETHLEDEAYEEALFTIEDAVDTFRKMQDPQGLADILRLRTHAVCLQASRHHENGKGRMWDILLRDEEKSLRTELQCFRDKDDKRGEACMFLALAKILCCMRTGVSEALDCLLDAQDLARDLPDTELEAMIAYELCIVQRKHHHFKAAIDAGKDARKLFRSLGDRKNESRSWSALAQARIKNGCGEDGIRCLKIALTLSKDIGNKMMEASCLRSISDYYLVEKEDHRTGISFAEHALTVAQQLKPPQSTRAMFSAHYLLIQGYMKMRDFPKALKTANEYVELAVDQGSKKDMFRAMTQQIQVWKMNGDQATALDLSDKAYELAEAVAEEMGDPRMKAEALELQASVYETFRAFDEAESLAESAALLLEDMTHYTEEAFSMLQHLAMICVKKYDDYSIARKVLERAKKVVSGLQDNYLEGTAALGISGCWYGDWNHENRQAMDMAKKSATLAKEFFHELGFERGQVRVLKLAFCDYFLEEQNYGAAVDAAREGFLIAREVGDTRTQAQMKLKETEILLEQDEVPQAAEVAMEALKLARLAEDTRLTAGALIFLVSSNHRILMEEEHVERGQDKTWQQTVHKLARKSKEALSFAVKLDDQEMEARARIWVAKVSLLQNLDKQAQQQAENAYTIATEIGEGWLQIDALIELALATDSLGDQPKAKEYIEEACHLARSGGYEQEFTSACLLLEQLSGTPKDSETTFQEHQLRGRSPSPLGETGSRTQVYRPPDLALVRMFIAKLVKAMAARKDATIDDDEPVSNLGIDSLASVELRTQLQQEFHVSLPTSFVIDYATVREMAERLVEECTSRKVVWRM